MGRLEGRRIIVTGGARGIGAAVVRAFAGEGASVVSVDVDEAQGRSVADAASVSGAGCVRFLPCDVSRAEAVHEAFNTAVDRLGGLDVLAHIAGVERSGPAEDVDPAQWEWLLSVNALGTLLTNQAAFRHMKEHGGSIINFASGAGVKGTAGLAAYAASKGAVLGWSRSIAREWARHGIRVNCVCPGIWTPMYDAHRARMTPQELAAHDLFMAGNIPLGGRLGDADRDLAPAMVFLAGEGARFITGQTLPVDGGMLMLT